MAKYCSSCGKETTEGIKFCPSCGKATFEEPKTITTEKIATNYILPALALIIIGVFTYMKSGQIIDKYGIYADDRLYLVQIFGILLAVIGGYLTAHGLEKHLKNTNSLEGR